VRGLKKTYGAFTLSVDFEAAGGEILVLAGPSGSGKTTALHLIAGLAKADGGTVVINGKDVTALPAWKRNVSVVFQDAALFPHLNAGGNVSYGPFIRGVSRKERRELADKLLRLVRLEGYAKRNVTTLSGGEKQRVAIARALAVSPAVLLLDEPFSSLDAPLRRELREEFRCILSGAGAPCIFVTHDRDEAAVLGDRIALMRDGRVVETGTPEELFSSPKTEFGRAFFTKEAPVSRALISVP
jgi:ABC-type Fe3+/spermidine/putrescine transport system ATPase subunit